MSEIQKRKILVIDDDRAGCNLISQTLEDKGVEVIIISEPEEAIEKATQIKPDLIFIGLLLSWSNGLKVSKSIHSVESLKKVPIIMLISYPAELNPQYAATIGIVDVLEKPLNTDELVSKTLNILDKDTVSSEGDKIFQGFSVKEESEEFPIEEKPRDLEGAEAESITAMSESLETSKEEIIEPKEDYEGEDYKSSYSERKKSLIKKLFPIYVAVSILIGFGIGAFLFTDTGEELLGTFLKETFEKKEPVQKETITEILPVDDIKTEKVVLPADIDKSKKITTPLTPEKPKALKKAIYSVQVGAFENEKNAVSFTDKLKQKGYDAFIRKGLRANKKPFYRVLIGKFDRKNNALEQSKILLQKEGIKSFVYRN